MEANAARTLISIGGAGASLTVTAAQQASMSPEEALEAEPQGRGPPDRMAISVDVVPSGDDPYPRLSYVIFDVPPSWSAVGLSINAIG